jgi:hypothetical protein
LLERKVALGAICGGVRRTSLFGGRRRAALARTARRREQAAAGGQSSRDLRKGAGAALATDLAGGEQELEAFTGESRVGALGCR